MWGILLAVIVPCRSSSSTSNQEEDFRRLMRIGNGKGVEISEPEDNDTSVSGIGNNGMEMLRNIVKGHDMEFSVESDPASLKSSREREHTQRESGNNEMPYSGGYRRSGQARGADDDGSISSDTQTKKRERRSKKYGSDDESGSAEGRRSMLASTLGGRSDRKHRPGEAENTQSSYSRSEKTKRGKTSRKYKENENDRPRKGFRSDLDSESIQGQKPRKPGSGKRMQKSAKREVSRAKDSEVSSSNFVESIKKMRASKARLR